jgi:tetratricopeptide (TPR) repeat protein
VVDAAGKPLSAERSTQDSTVRVQLTDGLSKDASTTLTFEYEGELRSADQSPVEGLKLASIDDDTSYLLYAGRWFPVNAYGINRFTAAINITLPAHMTVIGSGRETVTSNPPPKKALAGALPTKTYSFVWDRPSFPGTIVAGQFLEFKSNEAGVDIHVFFKPIHKDLGAVYAETAVKEFTYYVTLYGPLPAPELRVVELPDDTVPAAWAPEISAIASRAVTGKVNYRLLANTIAHQWWGTSVSPASRDDWWLENGFARYSEARYVEQAAGSAGLDEVVKDMSVGALAYDTVPLATVGKLDQFSPEFQSLVTDKGGMILHMLRWVEGDQKYDLTMRQFFAQYAGKSASTDDFKAIAEKNYGDQLTWFFSQWFDSTGAPEFKTKYTIYRLGSNKGFRVVGQISQDLDLFRMPVTLRVETEGNPEEKTIEVVGTSSEFVVETFGKPKNVLLDPKGLVLRFSTTARVAVAIRKGEQFVEVGEYNEALKEYQKALDVARNSSLAHFRIGQVHFLEGNWSPAANEFREAINGDLEPKWTEVWSHINLGKIFDVSDQRDRALNEYRQAARTKDNTQGALDEAAKYTAQKYEKQRTTN